MMIEPTSPTERTGVPSSSAFREREITRVLRERAEEGHDSATAAEIYAAVSHRLADTRTIQSYYKTLDRLVSARRLQVSEGAGQRGREYQLARGVSLSHSFTLDDIREAVLYRRPAAILAAIEQHNEFLERNRDTVLRQAGERLLLEKDPAELVLYMFQEEVGEFEAIIAEYGVAPDSGLLARAQEVWLHLQRVFLRELGLSDIALSLPLMEQLQSGNSSITYDLNVARSEIRSRVFGSSPLCIAEPPSSTSDSSVAGSDATVRFSELRLMRAASYQDENAGLVSINSSLAVEALSPSVAQAKGRNELLHSLPLTREAVDDPKNRGMIMLRAAYQDLSDSEYEHAKKAATDVVQWRVDAAVFKGLAPDLTNGELLPRPQVHFRDGTVVPQEREHKHYVRNDAYGEFTREGLRATREILQALRDSRGRRRVFAGTVKSPQSRFFGSFLNWYIRSGSSRINGQAIDPNWQLSRSAMLPDHIYLTHLFASLPKSEPGKVYSTFLIARTFSSTTEFFMSGQRVRAEGGWANFIARARELRRAHKLATQEPLDWDEGADLADDDFVYACDNVQYASFYLGTTAPVTPAPLVPRYEFILPVIDDQGQREQWVMDSHCEIIAALSRTGFMADRDHNYLSNRTLTRILPAPVQRAHELCKHFGGALEKVLHGAVAQLLSRTGRRRIASGDVELQPADPEEVIQELLSGDYEDEDR
jgi:hypothetical protein